jgi:hypothetical protein
MDKESADAASQKADKLAVKVGYPLSPDTRNARSIAYYYYLVKIDEKNFFGNILSARLVFRSLSTGKGADEESGRATSTRRGRSSGRGGIRRSG